MFSIFAKLGLFRILKCEIDPEVDSPLLTIILRQYEDNDSLVIDKFETVLGCEPGGCLTSEVHRLLLFGTQRVRRKTDSYKNTLIVKRLPKNRAHAALYCSHVALQNEEHAYNIIIPALAKFAAGEYLPVPNCIHARKNLIILQDLEPLDFQPIDISAGGFTLHQCRSVVQALAKLHAASLVLAEREPETMCNIIKLTQKPILVGNSLQLIKTHKCYIDFALNIFNMMEQNDDTLQALLFLTHVADRIGNFVKEQPPPNRFSVIIHGDVWVGNVLFNKRGELKLIDFQQMRYSSVAADLCYLFYVNLKPSMWAANITFLLEEYLEALQRNTKEMGVNMDEVLTTQWLSFEMSRFALYGFMRALSLMPMFFYKQEEVYLSEFTPEMLGNIDDMLAKAGPGYVERVKELVLNYVKHL